jgi:hypothetical protein
VEATIGFEPMHRGFAVSGRASVGVRGWYDYARTGDLF